MNLFCMEMKEKEPKPQKHIVLRRQKFPPFKETGV